MILDYAAPDIQLPIAILLIQILDVIFHSIQKSHYTSSSFWMPGRFFTAVMSCSQIAMFSTKIFYLTKKFFFQFFFNFFFQLFLSKNINCFLLRQSA